MSIFEDLTGQQFGSLIALRYIKGSQNERSAWECECQKCGNIVKVTTNWLHKNKELGRDGCKHVRPVEEGQHFGYLTVLNRAEDYIKPKSRRHERQWLCKCICGREKIIYEANLKTGKSMTCGMCNNRVSIPEKTIAFYLSKKLEIQENYRPSFLDGTEIDIYIPNLKVGIEYDGERWHKDISKDILKDRLCEDNGIVLIRMREPKCPISDAFKYTIITPKPTTNGTHMTEPIVQLVKLLNSDFNAGISIDVDCLRDNATICSSIMSTAGNNSLSIVYPEIAKEWDYKKNSPLTPDKVSAHAGKKAWWLCPNGHSYNSVIASRTGKDSCGCPICSNKGKSLYENGKYIGEHSLAIERPDIAAEFMTERNGISPKDISVSSNKMMWFKCAKCGYEWKSKVNNRTSSNNQGCYKCGLERTRKSHCKAVFCVETGKTYESATAASNVVGVSRSKITACCRGHQETSGGYHWRYVEDI